MIYNLFRRKDSRWGVIFIAGLLAAGVWDVLFLNKPALRLVATGFFNTFIIAGLVVVMTLAIAWAATLCLNYLESRRNRTWYLLAVFLLNIVRSVPQIIGILFGYIAVSALALAGAIRSSVTIFPLLALSISLFVFLEFVDLMRERIDHYRKSDFYSAMRVCGISEARIINIDILWKNSRIHILNKLISVFGAAIFLQCSVDFIISVGLSTDVNASTLPATMGSMLANIDSKQDILAVSTTLTNPAYLPQLFTVHLQGVTVAFVLVYTLLCVYNISNGFAEKHRL